MFSWFLILIAQSATFTLVSRARNSKSIAYHSAACVISSGVFFVSQILMIGFIAKPGMAVIELMKIGSVYTVATTLGSTLMHYASLRWIERKVGA